MIVVVAVIAGCFVGTVVALALLRGARYTELPEPILRARPKSVDYTKDGVR